MKATRELHKVPIYNDFNLVLIHATKKKHLRGVFPEPAKSFFNEAFSGTGDIYASVTSGSIDEGGLNKACAFVIFNTENKYKPMTVGTIAHEALHVVDEIQQHLGIEHDPLNSEPTAYLLGYVTDLLYDFLKRNSNF